MLLKTKVSVLCLFSKHTRNTYFSVTAALLCQSRQFTVGAISPSASHPSQIIFGQIASLTNCSYLTNGAYMSKCNWPPCTILSPSNIYQALCTNILHGFSSNTLGSVFILKMHVIRLTIDQGKPSSTTTILCLHIVKKDQTSSPLVFSKPGRQVILLLF